MAMSTQPEESVSAVLELRVALTTSEYERLEASRRVRGPIRLALQVPNLKAAMERLLTHGATLVHGPVKTPWGDYNARLQDPDGMQTTLFQVSDQ
jgi:uncharacterized glyoxalase superfamily protein PhnB